MIRRFSLLQAFVAVARSGKMKDAADQLSLTPGAVSQRIRQLEEVAGYRVFERSRTGVELSPAGAELFAALAEPFSAIEAIDRDLEVRPSRRVVVTTMPSFATTWLVPRLKKFSEVNADIEVVVEANKQTVDLRQEPVDLAIRHGLGKYPGLEASWLIAPELLVVASPELLKNGPPLHKPADCLSYPLLHRSDRRDWALWFEAHGVRASQSKKGPAFSDDHLIVQAAVAGQGLALVRDIYAKDNLHLRKLISVLSGSWPVQFSYYIVGTSQALQKPAVRRFRDWIVAEAKRETDQQRSPRITIDHKRLAKQSARVKNDR
jgi:LysR family transcriptional regulator, glycine cleavage system transcriptional activator